MEYLDIARMLDHALLAPQTTELELVNGCEMGRAYEVASICILPFAVPLCARVLKGSEVRVSTTIGFPHGGVTTSCKLRECEVAIEGGCEELDVVVNISQVVSGNWAYVSDEIKKMTELVHAAQKRIKVIFENHYLSDESKVRLCHICSECQVDWVKTSTGFASTGATESDVQLMRRESAPNVQVKAAGGIRDLKSVLGYRSLGATRCGTSKTREILDALRLELGLPQITGVWSATAGY